MSESAPTAHPYGGNCCDKEVADAIHQPPLPKWIKCAKGHVLELTDAYRFVVCPWCQSNLTVQW